MFVSRSRALGLIFFTLAWLVNDHYRPWVNFHSEAVALAGLLLLLVSYLLGASRSLSIPLVVTVIASVACVPWLQWLAGTSPFIGDALVASLYLSALAMAVVVGYEQPVLPHAGAGRYPAFMIALCVAAIFSAAIGLAQWFAVQDRLLLFALQTDPGDRAMSNLGQPNQLATLLLMTMAAYALAYEKKLVGSPTFLIGIAFLSFVLLLTESRAGLISVAALAVFLIWKNSRMRSRLPTYAVVLWAVSCWAGRALLPLVQEAVLLGSGRGMALADVQSRVLIWKQVAAGVAQAPWFGYGWNQTPAAHAAGSLAFPGSQTFSNAHNVVLDLLAWNGIPLGLVLVAACVWWLIDRMRRVDKPRAVYAMACLLPLGVHSMLEFPFAYAYFLVAAGLLIGVVESSIERRTVVRLPRTWVWALLGVWVTAGMWIAYEYLQVELDFQIVRFENMKIGITPLEYQPPDIRVLSHLGTMLRMSRVKPSPGMSREQLKELNEVAARFPYGTLALRNAVALGLNGDPAGASRQMAIIRGMYGEDYYAAAKEVMRSLEAEKYPQLKAIRIP